MSDGRIPELKLIILPTNNRFSTKLVRSSDYDTFVHTNMKQAIEKLGAILSQFGKLLAEPNAVNYEVFTRSSIHPASWKFYDNQEDLRVVTTDLNINDIGDRHIGKPL